MLKIFQYGIRKGSLLSMLQIKGFANEAKKSVKITYAFEGAKENKTVDALVGQSLLDVAQKYELPLEGACEGNCACGTCHVLLDNKLLSQLPEPGENEEDVLQVAFGRKANSRMACQIKINENMNGAIVTVPAQTRNIDVKKF